LSLFYLYKNKEKKITRKLHYAFVHNYIV